MKDLLTKPCFEFPELHQSPFFFFRSSNHQCQATSTWQAGWEVVDGDQGQLTFPKDVEKV